MKNVRFFILIKKISTRSTTYVFVRVRMSAVSIFLSFHIIYCPFFVFFCFCIFPPLFTGSLIRYIVDNDGLLLLFFSLVGTASKKKSTYHHHYHSHSLSFINVLFRIVVGKLIIINT
jgi:hypothetical protein